MQPPPPPPPPPTPATPALPATAPGVDVVEVPAGGATAAEMLAAARAYRRELGRQLEGLEGRRQELARRIQGSDGASRQGLEARLAEIDKRIADVDRQIAQADARVAQAALAPRATAEPPRPQRSGPPPEVFIVPVVFIVFVVFPLTLAWIIRMLRRTPRAAAPVPSEYAERLSRIEQAVETVAVEVERIGEGQRFMSRIFANPTTARQLEVLVAQAEEGEPAPRR